MSEGIREPLVASVGGSGSGRHSLQVEENPSHQKNSSLDARADGSIIPEPLGPRDNFKLAS